VRFDNAQAVRIWNASAAGIGAAAVVTMGKINLTGMQRTRGSVTQDVAGTLVINQYALPADTVPAASFSVPVDVAQPPFRYTWDVIVIHPYVEITFTNGGAPSTFFRASALALPT
jgi:hypothetical protein